MTAHHSVLIFEVLETATLPEWDDEEEIAPDAHELVQELYGIWDSLNQNKMLEAWHDAQQIRGSIGLVQSWNRGSENPRTNRASVLVYYT